MRRAFDRELLQLKESLVRMAGLCTDAISFATQAVLTGRSDFGITAIEAERESDALERRVRGLCARILLEQQPVASDLNMVSSSLNVIGDMERICDMGEDIALLVQKVHTLKLPSFTTHLAAMVECIIGMLTAATDSFIKHDVQLAEQVCSMDDEADRLFCQLKDDIVDAMIEGALRGDREAAESALNSLMIAKYLERTGDHAENIAQETLRLR